MRSWRIHPRCQYGDLYSFAHTYLRREYCPPRASYKVMTKVIVERAKAGGVVGEIARLLIDGGYQHNNSQE